MSSASLGKRLDNASTRNFQLHGHSANPVIVRTSKEFNSYSDELNLAFFHFSAFIF
jgi:hypothetical protein